jgi:hypothetical protein
MLYHLNGEFTTTVNYLQFVSKLSVLVQVAARYVVHHYGFDLKYTLYWEYLSLFFIVCWDMDQLNTVLTVLFPTFILLSRHNMFFWHVEIKIRQLFLRPAACLTWTLLETGVGE